MSTAIQTSTHYTIDAKASRFTVQAFASGLVSVIAHCPTFSARDFTGDVKLSMPAQDKASCRLVFRAASLDLMDDVTQQDRREIEKTMFHEVLHIQKFPEIAFESSQITITKVSGNMHRVSSEGTLSLHGVTARHAMSCQAVFGEDSIRIYGDCTLLQTDFNITIASVANGALKLRNELRLAFFLIARRDAS
jgi:polyisoprenoid-binding protein YceI